MQNCNSINVYFDPARFTVEESVALTAAAGYRALDFCFWDWSKPGTPFSADGDEWRDWVRSAADAAKRVGASFRQAHATVFDFRKDDGFGLRQYRRAIEGSAICGIVPLVFHPVDMPELSYDDALEENRKYYLPLVEYASSLGVVPSFENLLTRTEHEHLTAHADNLVSLADSFGGKAGICWDTGHALINKCDQYAELHKIGHRLTALHLQDNFGAADLHYCPFYGKCDWNGIMRGVREADYKGELTFEVANFVRPLPIEMRTDALRICIAAGNVLLGM